MVIDEFVFWAQNTRKILLYLDFLCVSELYNAVQGHNEIFEEKN